MIPSFLLKDIPVVRDMFVQAGCPDNGRPAGDPLSPEEIAVLQPQLETCRVTSQQFD